MHKRDNASVCIAPGEIQRGRAGEREGRREREGRQGRRERVRLKTKIQFEGAEAVAGAAPKS